jgi:ABC-type sugar transport system substrate-binding protein
MKRRQGLLGVAGLLLLACCVAVGSSIAAAPISTVTAGTSGKWVKYDQSTCKYVPTKSMGDKYTAVLTKSSKPYKIAWGTQDTVFPFTLLLNADIEKQAKAAGLDLKVWDNKGNDPSVASTQPVTNASQIVAWHPDLNLWMNTNGPLTAKTMSLFNAAKPCIPTVQFYISPGTNAIYFGNSQPQQGIVAADYAAPIIKKRGWDLAKTWIVSTGSISVFGSAPGSAQERITAFTPELRKLLPGIPANQVTYLDCNTTPACRTSMADWITAHPQAKYIVGDTVYDIRSLGAYAALKAAGFKDNALLVGNGKEPAAVALVKANDPIMVATLDPGEQNGGKYVVALAEDILAGKPVPTGTFIPVTAYCANRCGK